MAKEGRDIVKEAVKDAKALREAALAAAKNELIEGMVPGVRRFLETEIKRALGPQNEDQDRIRRGVQDNWPGESHTGFEEAKEKGDQEMDMKDKDLDMEALNSFFPNLGEADGEDHMAGDMPPPPPSHGKGPAFEAEIPTLEGDEPDGDEEMVCEPPKRHKKEKGEDEGDMDEEIEISEEALRKVYEASLQTEVEVKKGFSDMTKAGELDDVVKDAGKGLADVKKGESAWEKEEPPAKQDYSVKEAIMRGLRENKVLRERLGKAVQIIQKLGTRLHEVNLFNAKVMHVNRILNRTRLTTEQKRVVMESIDKARTIDEVKMVFETIVSSFEAARSLVESRTRAPKANSGRGGGRGAPDKKEVLSESVDRAPGDKYARLRQLAGLVK